MWTSAQVYVGFGLVNLVWSSPESEVIWLLFKKLNPVLWARPRLCKGLSKISPSSIKRWAGSWVSWGQDTSLPGPGGQQGGKSVVVWSWCRANAPICASPAHQALSTSIRTDLQKYPPHFQCLCSPEFPGWRGTRFCPGFKRVKALRGLRASMDVLGQVGRRRRTGPGLTERQITNALTAPRHFQWKIQFVPIHCCEIHQNPCIIPTSWTSHEVMICIWATHCLKEQRYFSWPGRDNIAVPVPCMPYHNLVTVINEPEIHTASDFPKPNPDPASHSE